MKYVVFLGDGMADLPVEELNNLTPLDCASHPGMDLIAQKGRFGMTQTIPQGMPAGSDVANMSVLGYDPRIYYSGRSPFEALSIGIDLKPEDVTYRCNLVTLSEESQMEDATMIDYSAGEIDSDTARENIVWMQKAFNSERIAFYPGISYRHCLVLRDASVGAQTVPPHDISGKPIRAFLPKGNNADLLRTMMEFSYQELNKLPVNKERAEKGLNSANAVWLWGEGRKPSLPSFKTKYNVCGGMISAVDLLQGIAKSIEMEKIAVSNITGNYHTDFAAKGKAAIQALDNGLDFVYIHVEAPDECGHHGELKEKIWSIEQIDQLIIQPVLQYLENSKEDFGVLVMPDHPTPLKILTHSSDPVPFAMYFKGDERQRNVRFTEQDARGTGVFEPEAFQLMNHLIKKDY
jgi:2,3-bisphosphoglycerate-independent phosphoglycerate mutase